MRSAEVTHAHSEAILGAVAVAVAAAETGLARLVHDRPDAFGLLDSVLGYLVENPQQSSPVSKPAGTSTPPQRSSARLLRRTRAKGCAGFPQIGWNIGSRYRRFCASGS
jgi:hypothetical protein